jgi:hypothetical protein
VVNKVLPREAPAAQQAKQEQAQYTRAWTTAEAMAYYNVLKDRFKVQINVPKPPRAPRAGQSFGAADYDQLSELGRRQSDAPGRVLARARHASSMRSSPAP